MIVAAGVTVGVLVATFVGVVFADYVSRKVSSTFVLTVVLLTYVAQPVSSAVYKVGYFIYWVLCTGFEELLRISRRVARRIFNFVCDKIHAAIDFIIDAFRALRDLVRRIVRPLYDVLVWAWDVLSYIFDFTTLWASVKSTTALFLYIPHLVVDFCYGLSAYRYDGTGVVQNIVALPEMFRNCHISTEKKMALYIVMVILSAYIMLYVGISQYLPAEHVNAVSKFVEDIDEILKLPVGKQAEMFRNKYNK